MRLRTFLGSCFTLAGMFLIPTLGFTKSFNEMTIDKMEGTIMVQPLDGSKPYALGTTNTVQRGDTLTVYDKSWIILKSHNGDLIGIDGNTVVVIDESYIEGPDRQFRLLLQKGSLMLKANGRDSRQSFFEINTGSVVTAINDTRCILTYDPAGEAFNVKYFTGKLTVIDKDNEEKFKAEHTQNDWKAGKKQAEEPGPVEEVDLINFNKFFDGDPRITTPSNSFLLQGSD